MISEEKKQVIAFFDQGRTAYKFMKFEEALQSFKQALQIDPNDGPSLVYLDRCKHYLENPPPPDWDGVFVMETK